MRVVESRPVGKKSLYKIIILVLLVSAAIVMHLFGWLDWRWFVEQGEQYAHTWWFAPAIIIIMVVFYTFALPGSLMIWVARIFL